MIQGIYTTNGCAPSISSADYTSNEVGRPSPMTGPIPAAPAPGEGGAARSARAIHTSPAPTKFSSPTWDDIISFPIRADDTNDIAETTWVHDEPTTWNELFAEEFTDDEMSGDASACEHPHCTSSHADELTSSHGEDSIDDEVGSSPSSRIPPEGTSETDRESELSHCIYLGGITEEIDNNGLVNEKASFSEDDPDTGLNEKASFSEDDPDQTYWFFPGWSKVSQCKFQLYVNESKKGRSPFVAKMRFMDDRSDIEHELWIRFGDPRQFKLRYSWHYEFAEQDRTHFEEIKEWAYEANRKNRRAKQPIARLGHIETATSARRGCCRMPGQIAALSWKPVLCDEPQPVVILILNGEVHTFPLIKSGNEPVLGATKQPAKWIYQYRRPGGPDTKGDRV